MAEDNFISSPKASSQEDVTSMSSSMSSRDNKSPQALLDQADIERQKLVCKRIKLAEIKIKMEEDLALKATQERQKHEQQLRQNELALEAVELVVKTQLIEAAMEASKRESKTIKESKNSDHQVSLAKAYQQYQEELLQVEKNFAENPWRKGTVRVPKIARDHDLDTKTLLK